MQRYFAESTRMKIAYCITGEDCRHIVRVMRMNEQEKNYLLSIRWKNALSAEIVQISTEEVIADVYNWKEENSRTPDSM